VDRPSYRALERRQPLNGGSPEDCISLEIQLRIGPGYPVNRAIDRGTGVDMSAIDNIEHVVVLMLENHSFDQMLGCMSAVYDGKDGRDRLDGIDVTANRSNVDDKGKPFSQTDTAERQMQFDPHHEVEHVAVQLQNNNGGFVLDFIKNYPNAPDSERQNVMGYYKLDSLPALHPLARNYTVCDHWFSSLPGPTWPNRFFALSGTCLGRVDMPGDGTSGADLPGFFAQTQDTIFDRLNEKQVTWKVYFHDIPQSWTMKQLRAPHNAAQYFYIRRFYEDARGHPEDFPQFSLIEPDYMGFIQNDDHPPHDIMKAQKLIADVYNALRGNEALWRKTLLVVFYDEHGGFYDHVVPPSTVAPDNYVAHYPGRKGPNVFNFKQFGLRVPAILASPWVKAGVCCGQFDHTSLLRYVIDKWKLRELDSERVKQAKSIAEALTEDAARLVLPHIGLPAADLKPAKENLEDKAVEAESEHQTALRKLTEFLPTALWEKTKETAIEVAVEAAPKIAVFSAEDIEFVKKNVAAGFDSLRGWCERRLAGLYETGDHEVVISSPDKVDQKYTGERNRVVRFLSTQKSRAIEGLRERVDNVDGKRTAAEQLHAARIVASIYGRKVHRDQAVDLAKYWLRRPRAGK
jgi:phospholipase C